MLSQCTIIITIVTIIVIIFTVHIHEKNNQKKII